jgi:hypothetical protein
MASELDDEIAFVLISTLAWPEEGDVFGWKAFFENAESIAKKRIAARRANGRRRRTRDARRTT